MPTTKGKKLRIAVDVTLTGPNGDLRTLQALYNLGAEINLINEHLVQDLEAAREPKS